MNAAEMITVSKKEFNKCTEYKEKERKVKTKAIAKIIY